MLSRAVSLAFALVATVLLVLGLLREDGLGLIYLSIGCSAVAAAVLVAAVRRGPAGAVPEPEAVDERLTSG